MYALPHAHRRTAALVLAGTLALVLTFICWRAVRDTHAAAPVTLPIEVIGAEGTTREVSFDASDGARANRLWVQIHGLTYQNKGSIQVNNGPWVSLANATPGLNVAEPGKGYGGIGGGFQTLKMTIDLPAGTAINGTNVVRFRFNKTDGFSSGFRVLALNLLDANGQRLVADSAFVQDNPDSWQLPRNTPADIAAGKELWLNASLVEQPGGRVLIARCASCHVESGYDLKYFNYSNYSIIERAKFHGLSQQQGEQIASYIRSLDVPNPGRPWNPPYQPGPGLDSKPVEAWAAGAGLEWALDSDADVAKYMQGGGTDKNAFMDANRRFKTFNFRETPKAMQFLDWNHWLPKVHPADAIGASAFANHNANKQFLKIRAGLRGESGMTSEEYIRGPMRGDMDRWKNYVNGDDERDHPSLGISTGGCGTQEKCTNTYAALWSGVKLFELMHEYKLEERGEQFYGLQGENRTWYSNRMVFNFAPHILGADGSRSRTVMDGTHDPIQDFDYVTDAWYEMQTILNAGARGSYKGGHHDVDWKYNWYFVGAGNSPQRDDRIAPLQGLSMSWKSIQESDSGFGPDGPGRDNDFGHNSWWGFSIRDGRPELGHVTDMADWSQHTPEQIRNLLRPLFAAWVERMSMYTPDQWAKVHPGDPYRNRDYVWDTDPGESYADAMRNSITVLKNKAQMDAAVVNGYADLGKYLYPRNNWDALKVPTSSAVAAPAGVQVTPGAGIITIQWGAVSGATSYNVKRSEEPNGVYQSVALLVNGTSFVDTLRQPGKTYYYKVSANKGQDVSADSSATGAVSAGTGLVLRYAFDENGTQINDTSTTGAWGKLIGTASRSQGRVGSALTLDGANGYAGSSQNLGQWIGRNSTVTAWIKTTATGSDDMYRTRGLMGSMGDPSDSPWLVIGALDAQGRIGARFWDGNTVRTNAPINDGQWHHVAFTRDQNSGEIRIYVDGQLASSGTSGAGYRISRFFSIGRIDRLRSEPWPDAAHYWPGALDEVRIYNRVLNADEVRAVANENTTAPGNEPTNTPVPTTQPTAVPTVPTATAVPNTPLPTATSRPANTTVPTPASSPVTSPVTGVETSYEAEAAKLTAPAQTFDCAATCSGGKRVGAVGTTGTVEFTVSAASAGTYTLTIAHTNGTSGNAPLEVRVNGDAAQKLNMPPTGSFEKPGSVTVQVNLQAGTNTITLGNPPKFTVDIDRITVRGSGTGAATTATPVPTTPASATLVVSTLTLINADTNQPIVGYEALPNNVTLDLATLPTRRLSIRANTSPATVGSVRFMLNGSVIKTENYAPYAIAGDANGGKDYLAWTPSIGTHQLIVTPYSRANGGGTAGKPLTITLTVK